MQFANAESLMLVTLSDIYISFNAVHPLKVLDGIVVRASGRTTVSIYLQPEKAEEVKLRSIVTVTFLRLLGTLLLLLPPKRYARELLLSMLEPKKGTFRSARDEQPENTFEPIEVTVSGRITLVRPVHPEKAELPTTAAPTLML